MPLISLPETLKRLRQQRSLTQTQVADTVGVKQRTYASWESGRTEPAASHVSALAVCFAVSADHLLGLSPTPSALVPQSWVVDLSVVERVRQAESAADAQLSDSDLQWASAIPKEHAIMPSTEFQVLRMEMERLWKAPRRKKK